MATPKKKISKSRRNMRRFSAAYRLDTVTTVVSPINGEITIPHRVTLETIDAYIAERKKHKDARRAKSTQ